MPWATDADVTPGVATAHVHAAPPRRVTRYGPDQSADQSGAPGHAAVAAAAGMRSAAAHGSARRPATAAAAAGAGQPWLTDADRGDSSYAYAPPRKAADGGGGPAVPQRFAARPPARTDCPWGTDGDVRAAPGPPQRATAVYPWL